MKSGSTEYQDLQSAKIVVTKDTMSERSIVINFERSDNFFNFDKFKNFSNILVANPPEPWGSLIKSRYNKLGTLLAKVESTYLKERFMLFQIFLHGFIVDVAVVLLIVNLDM